MNKRDQYIAASRQARVYREFYKHLAVFVIVIGALALIDLMDGRIQWFFLPALGWGVALVLHGLFVFTGLAQMMYARRIRLLVDRIEEEQNRRL